MLLALAFALSALEWRVTTRNRGAPWNGYGAIAGVLSRANHAPMRHRVLVPWAIGWLPEGWRLPAYQVAKMALIAGALAACRPLVGTVGVLVVALCIAITFEYDYWDCYAELLGVALVLSGDPWLIALGGLIWGSSKETALLAPALAWAAGGNWAGLAASTALLAHALVWAIQGRAGLYCERWTLRAYNVPDLRAAWKRRDVGVLLSLAWAVALCVVVLRWQALPEALARTAGLSPIWVVAGWTLARGRETRVFLPTALWIAGGLRVYI